MQKSKSSCGLAVIWPSNDSVSVRGVTVTGVVGVLFRRAISPRRAHRRRVGSLTAVRAVVCVVRVTGRFSENPPGLGVTLLGDTRGAQLASRRSSVTGCLQIQE